MKKIILFILCLVGFANAATYNVAYGICNGGPADFKTGTPTITISNDTATFSEAQTNVLMGMGAMITYNTTSKCFIAPFGKISTTKWRVTTGAGTTPAGVSGQTVNSITHPFASINSAELTSTGYPSAIYLNNKSLIDADVNMYWACYCEQSTYKKDSLSSVIDSIVGDATHQFYIMSPTNISTECNLAMFPASAKYDSTLYRYKVSSGTAMAKTTSAAWMTLYNLQLWNDRSSAASSFITDVTITGETNRISRCIIIVSGPASGSLAIQAITHQAASAGTLIIDNNLIIGLEWAGTNTGGALRQIGAESNSYLYENTIIGPFAKCVVQSSGTATLSNNFIGSMVAVSQGTKNYDCYKTQDESEVNGTLTTQGYGVLFTDTTATSRLNWNYTPLVGANLIGVGTPLASTYDGDLLHANGTAWRPQLTTWDCGAVEYASGMDVTGTTHITGEHYSISGTGLKPATTCPTVSVGGTAATVDSCTTSNAYITLGGGTTRGNQSFSVTNSLSQNDTITGYIYTYPVLNASTRIYGGHYKISGTGLKPSSDPTITIGGVSATIDTAWSDSVHLTLGLFTPRDSQNLILTNSDTYKDTLKMKVFIGDHRLNLLCIGQSNMAGSDTGTPVEALGASYKWIHSGDTWASPAVDPQYGSTQNGCIPDLTNLLLKDYRDIGVVMAAFAGTGWVTWLNARDPANPWNTSNVYGKAITYVRESGGIDHILCWGGESDAIDGITADSLTRTFNNLITSLKSDLTGYYTDTLPIIFIAPHIDSGYPGFTNNTKCQTVRDAFTLLHSPANNRYLAGYATVMKNFDKVHADETGLLKAAKMFYRAIRYSDGGYTYCLGPRFASMAFGMKRDTIYVTLTKDSPTILPAIGAKGFRVKNGVDTITINSVSITANKIKLALNVPITVNNPSVSYLKMSPVNLDSLVHYNDSQKTFLEPTSRVFETSYIDTSNIPRVALGHLRIVPTSGDTAGGTTITFYADTLMTGSTCGEVASYTPTSDTTATGTSIAHAAGNLDIVVHSGAVDSTVVFRYLPCGGAVDSMPLHSYFRQCDTIRTNWLKVQSDDSAIFNHPVIVRDSIVYVAGCIPVAQTGSQIESVAGYTLTVKLNGHTTTPRVINRGGKIKWR